VLLYKELIPQQSMVMPRFLPDEFTHTMGVDDGSEGNLLGSACEHIVLARLQAEGKSVSKPVVDTGFDFLITENGRYESIQVKKAGKKSGNKIRFRFGQSSSRGRARDKTYDQAADWFYHVLMTQYRTVVFKTHKSEVIRDGGAIARKVEMSTFVLAGEHSGRNTSLTFDIRNNIWFAQYDPVLLLVRV